ncbi:MAG: HAMP domain-containing histidine kinase [Candidatus Schekmanbacteria bacterium]|nr:HAMP domain-containing histidine kinase [Candidatus Schekmanbacteria bacterium]
MAEQSPAKGGAARRGAVRAVWRWHRHLWFRLFAWLVILLSAFASINASAVLIAVYRASSSVRDDVGRVMSKLVAERLSAGFAQVPGRSPEAILQESLGAVESFRVAVLDGRGRPLALSDPGFWPAEAASLARRVIASGVLAARRLPGGAGPFPRMAPVLVVPLEKPIPVALPHGSASVAAIGFQSRGLTLEVREAARHALGATVAAILVLSPLVALLFVWPLRRRLRRMECAVDRLAAGDLGSRVPEQGSDELTHLALTINGMAERVSEQIAALAAADAGRRQLLADISHEVRTPLTVLQTGMETILESKSAAGGEDPGILPGLYREVMALRGLIDDLLDLSRMESARYTLRAAAVDLEALVEQTVLRFEILAQQSGAQLSGRKNGTEEQSIEGDADKLSRALSNLVFNALCHGGKTIDVTATVAGGWVSLSVQDSGSGVEAELLPVLFERFARGSTSRSRGVGLGLAIVKSIAELHGGTVAAANLHPGFRVTIRIPAARVPAA